MKHILLFSLALLALESAIVWFLRTPEDTFSFAVAQGVMWLNLGLLTLFWGRLLVKKKVALASILIVIKTLFLLALVGFILKQPGIKPSWFFIGIGGFFATVVVVTLGLPRKNEENT